jgi:FlaA1/EpsC-like NDP-sugar epimerase
MIENLYSKLKQLRNRYLFLIDVLVLCLAPAIAVGVRLDSHSAVIDHTSSLVLFTVVVVFIKLLIFERSGLYKQSWSYASSEELATLLKAVGIAVLAEGVVSYAFLYPQGILSAHFPRSIPVIDGLLTALLIGGHRLSVRLLCGLMAKRSTFSGAARPVLIAGAGVAGAMIVKELQTNSQLGLAPVGYLDDDSRKRGMMIHGVQVLGKLNDLPEAVKKTGATLTIIAMPTAAGRILREFIRECKSAGVETKTVPGIFEILRGSARVEQIRDVQIQDLLRRGAVTTDTGAVGAIVKGARVMVTGAGGSIGSELCRQIKALEPAELILVGHGENSIFRITKELRTLQKSGLTIRAIIADIRDRSRMSYVFKQYRPELVFHAAAHKHVGLMQENVLDAVTNNVLGTRNLVDLAEREGVKRFVMISSDKAVKPSCVMGATKRVAELVVHGASVGSSCAFMTVRFGNVLGSRGSVVPIFQQQIAAGGPVTVTHPDARRFFMTIPEAVHLVLQAAAIGRGSEVFVLDMGEQIRIVDIAKDLIRLSGLEEGTDIQIEYTGLLPGEKMFEEIFYPGEQVEGTCHDKIMVCRNGSAMHHHPLTLDGEVHRHERPLHVEVDTLIEAARQGSLDVVRALLCRIVPEFTAYGGMFGEEGSPARLPAPGPAVSLHVD